MLDQRVEVEPSLLPTLRLSAMRLRFPVRSGQPGWWSGEALRGAIGRRLLATDPKLARLYCPHEGTTSPWWLRFTPTIEQGHWTVILASTLETRDLYALAGTLATHQELTVPNENRLLLDPVDATILEPGADLLERATQCSQQENTLRTICPLVLTRGHNALRAANLDLGDLLAASWRRIHALAGDRKPQRLAGLPQLPIHATDCRFPFKGRLLPAIDCTIPLAIVPEKWRSLLVAGCLVNIGRCASIGGGSWFMG